MDELMCQSLAHACILAIASEPCLHPGEHLKDRLKPSCSVEEGKVADGAFGTWLARGAELVVLGRYGDSTIVYLPSQDMFYYASPCCLLSASCPDKTALLGQFVVDNDSTPRVLVYDLLRLQGASCGDMPVRERYACLQQLGSHLGSACTLQWVGEVSVLLRELRSGKFVLPHAIKGVMSLSSIPGRITLIREKRE